MPSQSSMSSDSVSLDVTLFVIPWQAQDLVALTGRYLSLIGRKLTSVLERKSETQVTDGLSISTYKNALNAIM